MSQQTGFTPKTPSWLQSAIWLCASILFALVQIPWAGYQIGVGNQGIQIAFLEKLHDHELFARDVMVSQTLASYPSFFFHLCARLLNFFDLSTLYLTLHILATAGVFATVIALSKGITRNRFVAIVTALFLLAGHHAALAGETLYSTGFTHTWAIFPLSLLALYLFFVERPVAAFLLAGIIFNFHALEAGHLFLIMSFAAVCYYRPAQWRRLFAGVGLFLLAALPTVIVMLTTSGSQRTAFATDDWLMLMHVRSAEHSFPSAWWQDGMVEVPRMLTVLALAGVALGYRLPGAMKRKVLLVAGGVGILFVAGTLFTDVLPVPLVIRAQFFRSSRLLYVLALIVIGNGCVRAWALPWARGRKMPKWRAWLEFGSATLTAVCLAVPSLMAVLPWALLLAAVTAVISARLAWYEALVAGAALLVCFLAVQTIGFSVPGLALISREHPWGLARVPWESLAKNPWPSGAGWIFLVTAVGLGLAAARARRAALLVPLFAYGTAVCVAAVMLVVPAVRAHSDPDADWVEAQLWIRDHTPKNAVVLIPPQESGFRIYSQRAVVGEWRDGTQLYFKADYKDAWWDLMNKLQPGKVIRPDRKSLMSNGTPLQMLEDDQIVAIATDPKVKADYIVLPASPEGADRGLEKVHGNREWTIYLPRMASFSSGDASLADEDKYIRQTVLPAIEKIRKSDVKVVVVDSAGKPLGNVEAEFSQTHSAFGFGCSLPFFQVPAVDTKADYKPPAVTPVELSRFLEVFNYSVIPFSGQWRFTEPMEGKPDYTDLDRYVAWCTENHVRPEFRFLAGYQPAWMRGKIARDQGAILLDHAKALAVRYGTRIMDWQVTSEDVGVREIGLLEAEPRQRADRLGAFFGALRKALPGARLGIADDARFWSPKSAAVEAKADMLRGIDTLRDLKKAGVAVDYIAIEGNHPLGLWAAGKQIYDTLDAFAREGVKIHITNFGVAVGDRVEGAVHKDGTWTPQMQADYYERFFAICYSHPAVEAINIMGISQTTWREGLGLLNEKGEPTPAFTRLKDLIRQRWRTRVSAKLEGGSATFRGFQGSYDLTLKLPGGKTATGRFEVVAPGPGVDPATANVIRLKLAADGTLTRAEAP